MSLLDKDVLTTGEVAKVCNVAPRTVSKWFDSGQLKGYRIPGSKDRRIPVANLMQFMKEHGIPMDGVHSGKMRVLVVDRERDVTAALQRVLTEQANYEVRVCNSAFEAGIECEKFRPHVVLLDMHMGDGEANAIAKVVNTNEDLAITRVIAMSGKLTDGQAAGLRGEGFDGFLKKPFQVRQVVQAIESASSLVH
ncbi:MAG: response regulator [Phycisphaeraceae bacterium]|nr:response regulator [Phycisphaerales bacterium]MCB9843422.1 response regulator [Phycisphaeraceae bacterium]